MLALVQPYASARGSRKGEIAMVENDGVTFEKRPVDPRAYKLLDNIVATTEAMRTAEAERSRHAKARAKAIKEARSGAHLRRHRRAPRRVTRAGAPDGAARRREDLARHTPVVL